MGPNNSEVVVSGKLGGQRVKSSKFAAGLTSLSGDPVNSCLDRVC